MRIGIIGSGVVGLTLAYEITNHNPEYEITIFEKEDNSIRHGTGRNSGVIHSGIYYTPNSLRSKLCIEGSHLMKKFIKTYNRHIFQPSFDNASHSQGLLVYPKVYPNDNL